MPTGNGKPRGKKMIFVSSGRCGTKRLSEILAARLPADVAVVHQMARSRLANVMGNWQRVLNLPRPLLDRWYLSTVAAYDTRRHFISTDPLSAMLIPRDWIYCDRVAIIHLVRDDAGFAGSMLRLTRARWPSFIAHNFIPLWQPTLLPMQNMLQSNAVKPYVRINRLKNAYFFDAYRPNPHYRQVRFDRLFTTNIVEELLDRHFGYAIHIPQKDLAIKSNAA